MPGEDVETNQNANGCTPSSVDASKSSNTNLQYYSSFLKVGKFFTELDEDDKFTFSADEKEKREKIWKRYYTISEQTPLKDFTDTDITENDDLVAMLELVSILRPALADDVATIKRCFEELMTKVTSTSQASEG